MVGPMGGGFSRGLSGRWRGLERGGCCRLATQLRSLSRLSPNVCLLNNPPFIQQRTTVQIRAEVETCEGFFCSPKRAGHFVSLPPCSHCPGPVDSLASVMLRPCKNWCE